MASKRFNKLLRNANRPDKKPKDDFNPNSDTMSTSQGHLCSFADVAISYRVYILDDLLAEPQEICHDWLRNLLYISRRYRQGHSFAPIESSHEIDVFDISRADIVDNVDISPYSAPHGLELDENCSYLHLNVADGAVWIDTETRTMMSHVPSSQTAAARQTNDDFIAEFDLRNGRMRQRVNVPESETTDGGFVTFSAPAIRFASRAPSHGLPLINVEDDPVVEAIRAKFNVRTLYVTSRNITLV